MMRRPWLVVAVAIVAVASLGLALFALKSFNQATARPRIESPLTPGAPSGPPTSLATAEDYLLRGDFYFDRHEYERAIADYSGAIELNPGYAQAYNNRGYTYMSKREYAAALADLDRAIGLRPDYVNALMNRGDIYNYYYKIDRTRAISDYDRVIAVGPEAIQRTSVCGHRFLAKHNGWNLGTLLDLPSGVQNGCD